MADELSSGATRHSQQGDEEPPSVKMDNKSQHVDLGNGREAAFAPKSELSATRKQVDDLTAERAVMLRHLESENAALASLKDESRGLVAAKERLECSVQALESRLSRATEEAQSHLALLVDKDREAFKVGELNVSLIKRVRELEERELNADQRFQSMKVRLEETAAQLQAVIVGRDQLVGEVERLEQDARRVQEEQRLQNWEQRVASLQQKLEQGASQIGELDKERIGLWRDLTSKDAQVCALESENKHLRAAKEMVEGSAQALQARVNQLIEDAELHCADKEAKCRSAQSVDDLETQLKNLRHRESVCQQHLQDVNTKLEHTVEELRTAIASRDVLLSEVETLQEKMHTATVHEQRLQSCQEDCSTLQRKLGESASQIDLLRQERSALWTDLESRDAEVSSLKDENRSLASLNYGMKCSLQALEGKVVKLLQESEINKSEMEEKARVASRLEEEYANQARCLKELRERESIAKQGLESLKLNLDKTADELHTAIASKNDLTMELQKHQENEICTRLEHAQLSQSWKERISSLEQQLEESATRIHLVQSERADVLRDLEVRESELAELRVQMKSLLAAKDMDESYVESLKARIARMNEDTDSMRSEAQEKDNQMMRLVQRNVDLEKLVKEQAERECFAGQRLHALKLKLDETTQELQTSLVTRDSLLREVETLQENIHGMVMEQEELRRRWEQSVSSFQKKANESAEEIVSLQNDKNLLLKDLEGRETELNGFKDQCKSLQSAKEALECSVQSLECRLEKLVKEAETNMVAMEEKAGETCRLLELNVNLERLVNEQTRQLGLAEQCIENLKKDLDETTAQLQKDQACRDCLAEQVQMLHEQVRCLKLEKEHETESWEQKLGILDRHIRQSANELESVRTERAALLKDLECREGELRSVVSENRQLVEAKEMAEFSVQNLQGKLTRAVEEAAANRVGIEEMAKDLEAAEAKAATRSVQLEELRVKIVNGDRVSARLVAVEGELHSLQGKLFEADQLVLDKEESLAASEWTVQHLASEISKAKNSLAQKDRKEANMQQQLEDFKMQLRSKEGEIIEMDCYLQQQLAKDELKQAELDKVSQKMQELEKGAADWLSKESSMKSRLLCLEDAVEERDTVLGDLEHKLKVQVETQEAMEGAIKSLKLQLADAEKAYRQKETEMESLCDDLEHAKQEASLAARKLKDLHNKMQQLDVILAQAAASKEREHSLEMVNKQLQQEATIVEEQSLARKNTLAQVLKQLEQNRAVNQALHLQMTSTHKRFLDDLNLNHIFPESCDEVWSEEAMRRKCKKMRRSAELTLVSSGSLLDTLDPDPSEAAAANARGSVKQAEYPAELSAGASENYVAVACSTKQEEEPEPPVTALETALVQLSVQRITIGQLHQEVLRLQSDLLQAGNNGETKLGEAGSERHMTVNVVSSEEYAHYLELCDSLVRKNVSLEKKVEAMERKSRGLQKQLEAYRKSVQEPCENNPDQDQGCSLNKQNLVAKAWAADATEPSCLRQVPENCKIKSLAECENLPKNGPSERSPLVELRSGVQSRHNSKAQASISRS